jgi:hypothetical protein
MIRMETTSDERLLTLARTDGKAFGTFAIATT